MSQPNTSTFEPISEKFISTVCQHLAQGKQVRRTLPLDGRLHIDRQLPFLVIYRQPTRSRDEGTRNLVLGEASYLIASGDKRLKPSLSMLAQSIVKTLAEKFKAFLIIEIWAAQDSRSNNGPESLLPKPCFRIISSRNRPPTATIEALEKSFKRVRALKETAIVEVTYGKKRSPTGLPMLISSREARQLNCFVLGFEIQPAYRNSTTEEIYPLVLRTLHRGVAREPVVIPSSMQTTTWSSSDPPRPLRMRKISFHLESSPDRFCRTNC